MAFSLAVHVAHSFAVCNLFGQQLRFFRISPLTFVVVFCHQGCSPNSPLLFATTNGRFFMKPGCETESASESPSDDPSTHPQHSGVRNSCAPAA